MALITGGATGIGAATAEHFARSGFDIALNIRTRKIEAQAVIAACEQAGASCRPLAGDVTVDSDCRRMASEAEAVFGGIDVLVNNAGTTKLAVYNDLDLLDRADFERIFAVNVIGAYQMTRACCAPLRRSKGAVVNISSHAGFSGYGSSLAYAASKGALNTMTLGLARALAPDIRVNAVCPGFVDTDWLKRHMTNDSFSGFHAGLEKASPLRRIVSATEVAEAVFWLATQARSATGQLFVLDAGAHLAVPEPV